MNISPSEHIRAEVDGAVGWMTFNNPERGNAITEEMLVAISAVLDHFEKNPAVHVIVLTGAGERAFTTGGDIAEFKRLRESPEAMAAYSQKLEDTRVRIEFSEKPFIAMINGHCVGMGLNFALACDLRISSDEAGFSVPAARMSHGYSIPSLKRLNDLIGHANVRDFLFTGRRFEAREVYDMGMINRVVKHDELLSYTKSYAAMIGENAPLTIAALKGGLRELSILPSGFNLAECERLQKRCFDSEDYVEGQNSFREKRKAVFKGK